jgi:hypothetical protein
MTLRTVDLDSYDPYVFLLREGFAGAFSDAYSSWAGEARLFLKKCAYGA